MPAGSLKCRHRHYSNVHRLFYPRSTPMEIMLGLPVFAYGFGNP